MAQGRIQASGAINERTGIFAAAPGVNINDGHSLIVDGYEKILHDYQKRDFTIGLLVNSIEASGPVHIFNEQKKLPSNAQAADPKVGFSSTATPDYAKGTLDTDYGRDNWINVIPRLYGTRIEYDYFALKAEQRYGSFEDLTAKDYNDMIVDYTRVVANDFWNGRSAGIADNSTGVNKFEYTGILSQIGSLPANVSAIADGTLIVDAIQTKVAALQMRLDYTGMPKVVAMNAATYDILVRQELARPVYRQNITTEIIPGWKVPAIATYVGELPVIITPYIKPVDNGATVTHSIALLNPEMIDRAYWFSSQPQFFEIATPNQPLNNSRLLTNKMMINFDNYFVRGLQTGSNFIMTTTVVK
jgi:hypothetical protein